jgi:predicted nucleotidyltransferase component of viral defense system
MEKDFAYTLASRTGIDVLQVVREEAEIMVLKQLFESEISEALVFKGGTALRLVYGSPRFSEDLDFSTTKAINNSAFKKVVETILAGDSRFSLKDLASKFYTQLAEIKIREPWMQTAFSLKIEVSKRTEPPLKKTDIDNALAKSPSTNLTALIKTYTLKRIYEEKLDTLKSRKMPRDVFDTWFICQKISRPFEAAADVRYPKGKIRQELRKFLPREYYPVVEELEKRYGQPLR